MKRLRDIRDRLDALVVYPAQEVIRGRLRLEADPNDELADFAPFARDQAQKLHAVISEMKRRDGGGV